MENNIVEAFKKNLQECFSDRIICLLYYGSNAYSREIKKNSDYDFCLVLDKRKYGDLINIRNITNKFIKIELTIHFLDDLEKDGWENFQSDNHGVFYLFHFASAKSIIGDNIFSRKIHLVNKVDFVASLRRQIIEYFWRMDNVIFTLNEQEILKCEIFRKYSVRILQDLLVSKGEISFYEINTINYLDFFNKFIKDKSYIQDESKRLLLMVIKRMPCSINELIILKELLYEDFKNSFNEL